jgi:C-terminal processing protease CtpA/Prc
MSNDFRKVVLVLFVVTGLACTGMESMTTATPATAAADCSTLGQVTSVRTTLRDIYYWYQQLPDPSPASFSSPEAYLEAVRYKPIDTTYSYVANKAESDAFFSDSQFIGIGFSSRQTGAAEVRIAQVFPNSPASDAGLARGDYLLAVNGKAIGDLIRTGEIDTVFGANQVGVTATLSWRTHDGAERQAQVTKRIVTIPTVSQTAVFDVPRGPRVGYVHLRNFVTPSTEALNTAFTALGQAGVNELILDLRYNGGGLVSVAQHLGGLIGGAATNGQVFIQFIHNDKNSAKNSTLRFPAPAAMLGVPRLFVITTRGSASASEAVINGLRPFMTVTLIGDTTYGKPVGQYGYDFCDKTLFPVAFEGKNARNEGGYFSGIPADCAATDDLDHPLGDASEASVAEALGFIRTGGCGAGSASVARALARREELIGRGLPRDGWRQLVNAN